MVSRAGRRPRRILWVGGIVGAVACAAVLAAVLLSATKLRGSEHGYWLLRGLPCPAHPGPRTSRRPPGQVFAFEGLIFARAAGAATCSGLFEGPSWARTEAVVCQFDHPVTMQVTDGRRIWRFFPDVGQPATLTLRGGALSCVLASNFRD